MNEASVSGSFMFGLRKRCPGAVVIKHHDASMIGLLDCSMTYANRIYWFEFKFYEKKRKWDDMYSDAIAAEIFADIVKKSPTQWKMACALNQQAPTWYVVWIKKTCIMFLRPFDGRVMAVVSNTDDAVQFVLDQRR